MTLRWLVLGTLVVAGGCTPALRPMRVAIAETAGDVAFSLEMPVERVDCGVRDLRRDPSDSAAYRQVWAARCTEDCRTAINYGDQVLDHQRPPEALTPLPPGVCYECTLDGRDGRGVVRFRVGRRGGVEPCR